MAALEEEGLIAQPHTSAGRIPTDKGYRLFVDRLSSVKPLSAPEKKAIATLLDGAVDLDDVVDRTVRLLAQLTHQVAVVQYPSLTPVDRAPRRARAARRRPVARRPDHEHRPGRAALVDAGADVRRGGPRRPACPAERCGRAARRLTEVPRARRVAPRARSRRRSATSSRHVLDALEDTLARGARGADRARRHGEPGPRPAPTSPGSIGPVLEALEEQVVLLKLLTEMADGHRRRSASGSAGSTSTRASPRRPSWRAATVARARWWPGSASLGPHPDGLPRRRSPPSAPSPATCRGSSRHDLPDVGADADLPPSTRPEPTWTASPASSVTDYYEILGVSRDASPERDQEGVPQAGPPAAPRRRTRGRRPRSASRRSAAPTRC